MYAQMCISGTKVHVLGYSIFIPVCRTNRALDMIQILEDPALLFGIWDNDLVYG